MLIVDEPTAGLDPVEQQRFRTLIGTLGAQGNRTILLSTHIVDDVATVANHLAVLERGQLVFQGSVRDLAARARGTTWSWRADVNVVDTARRNGQLLVTSLTPLDPSQFPGASTSSQVLAHVVGPQPTPEATPREPTLEDGYFTLMGRTEDDDR